MTPLTTCLPTTKQHQHTNWWWITTTTATEFWWSIFFQVVQCSSPCNSQHSLNLFNYSDKNYTVCNPKSAYCKRLCLSITKMWHCCTSSLCRRRRRSFYHNNFVRAEIEFVCDEVFFSVSRCILIYAIQVVTPFFLRRMVHVGLFQDHQCLMVFSLISTQFMPFFKLIRPWWHHPSFIRSSSSGHKK